MDTRTCSTEPEGAELERLVRTLGDARILRAEHLVFSRFTVKDLPVGTELFWRSVLDELRDTVRDECPKRI